MARLLVVEDNETTTQLVALYLSGAGHQVDEALSAHEAFNLAKYRCPDLIILDAHLPGHDSLDLVNFSRDLPTKPPVVLMTCCGGEKGLKELLDAGAREYVVKSSYFHNNLVSVVNQILGEAKEDWAIGDALLTRASRKDTSREPFRPKGPIRHPGAARPLAAAGRATAKE